MSLDSMFFSVPFLSAVSAAALFALSSSLDALIIGITEGIRKIHITLPQNLVISLITLTGTVLSILLGQSLAPLLSPKDAQLAGSALLITLGGYYLIKSIRQSIKNYLADRQTAQEHPVTRKLSLSAADTSLHTLTLRELLLLGISLSANNIGIGISASIAGISLPLSAVFTLLFSVCFLALGNRLGKTGFLRMADRFAAPLSGLLLIILGICESAAGF